jgi:hypothetical protein
MKIRWTSPAPFAPQDHLLLDLDANRQLVTSVLAPNSKIQGSSGPKLEKCGRRCCTSQRKAKARQCKTLLGATLNLHNKQYVYMKLYDCCCRMQTYTNEFLGEPEVNGDNWVW